MTKHRLIVGLGNIGEKYAWTRHNAGFIIVDSFAASHSVDFRPKPDFGGALGRIHADGQTILLFKPSLYMNNSGPAIRSVAEYYRIVYQEILIIQDDVDLDFGTIRIRQGGHSGGHKGINSINDQLSDYWRVRIGVKNEHFATSDTSDFVLAHFTPQERASFVKITPICHQIINDFVQEKVTAQTITV
jgi:PTH1 family peptidyl-tRNA hydrolase